jgi:RES domain-containing protein
LALDVGATRATGLWIKHTYPGAPPLVQRDPAPDNRWQRGHVVDALYLAADEKTAWAEWYRQLAERGLPPNEQMPRDLWTWEVDIEIADLSDPDRLTRVNLDVPRPGRRTWPPYQHVGEVLFDEGWAGLVTLSAARPNHRVLCLFRPAVGPVAGARPLSPPRRVEAPPPPPTGMTT